MTTPAFGYELIRNELISDMLGKQSNQMLYWAGKSLARKYPLSSIEEVQSFFTLAGWGNLSLTTQKKNEVEFELTSPLISKRFQIEKDLTYKLEAGFLAEQIQQMNGSITETYEKMKSRAKKVTFTVKSDVKDPID
ncbi:YslB family protein [Bacillus carboniphilus]